MMKILQIPNYQYPHIGGIEQVSRDIADSLLECTDIEQKIICFNEDATDNDIICKRKDTVHDFVNGVEVIRCGCIAKIASQSISLTYFRELRNLINNFCPDIIIFHYPNPFVAFLLLMVLPKNVKLILWWHLDIVKQKLLGKFFKGQSEKLCIRACKIVATSPNYIEGSYFLTKYKDKCVVIPNCIRPERFIEKEKNINLYNEIRSKYKEKVICFAVGRHIPYKGMEYLVRASKYLDDSYIILIGGHGQLSDSLKHLAKYDDKVVFLGKIKDDELVSYFKACDIFCFPSITKNEAFGIALAEAMYFGKPAVTFSISGSGVNYVNLHNITGIECQNKNYVAFADAIKLISSDSIFKEKLSKAAKERVNNMFLYKKFKKIVIEFLYGL